jgi:citrate lyase subunit beta/citryl-CoA lyase
LRSFLFAPGNHARRVEKALTLDADAVILDLEDAVATAEKPATRAAVAAALTVPRSGLLYVRVNAADTEFCCGDLVAVVQPALDGLILPKVESPATLATIDWVLLQIERERGLAERSIDLIPIIETARGLRDTAGIEAPLDTVWVDLQDAEGLEASARTALAYGFQGKMCIHPNQIAVVNRVFTPSEEEIAFAERVVAAFAKAEAEGVASIQLDGRFIDYPIVYRARRVLERIAAIRARESRP